MNQSQETDGTTVPDAAAGEPTAADVVQAEAAAVAAAAEQMQPPQHLYSAVNHERENVMNTFSEQRKAIRDAVADQRRNALAPIQATNARRAAQAKNGGTAYQAQMAELVLLLRAMVQEEVRRELDRRAALH